ncbi:MAG: radical SAM family heme chaperone HemW [Myxococcota bacterium]
MLDDDGSVGVYVHVPFCERICPYCDFAVVAARRLEVEREAEYLEALLAELRLRAPRLEGRRLASLYLGGGTPSLLRPGSVRRLVEATLQAFPQADGVEITLEANPGTLERGRLPGFREAGVNRLSLGVQSFDDGILKRLGRAHAADEARESLRAARAAGFTNLSLDLIFAAPGATLAQLDRDLEEIAVAAPEHVSAYELGVEAGTPFALAARRGQLALPDEDDAVRMFEQVECRLEAAGLARYEISSFATPGRRSVHNRRYWERRPVLGLGMGAWTIEPPGPDAAHGTRCRNLRTLPAYLEPLQRGDLPREGPPEVLDPATARGEALFLSLRTVQGLDAVRFEREFGGSPRSFFAPVIDEVRDLGLLEERPGGDLCLTPPGRLVSDSVFERFVTPPATLTPPTS